MDDSLSICGQCSIQRSISERYTFKGNRVAETRSISRTRLKSDLSVASSFRNSSFRELGKVAFSRTWPDIRRDRRREEERRRGKR